MIFGIFGKFGIDIGEQKYFSANIFDRKNFRSKKKSKMFGRKNFRSKKIDFFRDFFRSKYFFDQTFSGFFFDRFFSIKMFDLFFRTFFSTIFFLHFFLGSPISIPNFPKIPKITLRTACDHYKITNSAHEEKVTFFCTIYRQTPSWESEVHEPSVYFKL